MCPGPTCCRTDLTVILTTLDMVSHFPSPSPCPLLSSQMCKPFYNRWHMASLSFCEFEESRKLKVEKMYMYFKKKQKLIRIGIAPDIEHIPDTTSHIFFSILRPVRITRDFVWSWFCWGRGRGRPLRNWWRWLRLWRRWRRMDKMWWLRLRILEHHGLNSKPRQSRFHQRCWCWVGWWSGHPCPPVSFLWFRDVELVGEIFV